MSRRKKRSRGSLKSRPKGRGKAGGKWSHGFVPRNAVAKKLKNKTYGRKSTKARSRKKR